MKRFFKIKYGLLICCILPLIMGCNPEPKNFSLTFTMESVDAYKLVFTTDQSGHYTIQEQYILFERRSNSNKRPEVKEGIMNEADIETLKKLIAQSKLFKMKEAYGFDKEEDQALNDVIYHIHYSADGKEKYISLRLDDSNQFPLPFAQLIEFLNLFINEHKK